MQFQITIISITKNIITHDTYITMTKYHPPLPSRSIIYVSLATSLPANSI